MIVRRQQPELGSRRDQKHRMGGTIGTHLWLTLSQLTTQYPTHCQLSHLNTMVSHILRLCGVYSRCDALTSAFLWGAGQLIKVAGSGQWTSVSTMAQLTRMALWLTMAVCGLGNLAQGNVHGWDSIDIPGSLHMNECFSGQGQW